MKSLRVGFLVFIGLLLLACAPRDTIVTGQAPAGPGAIKPTAPAVAVTKPDWEKKWDSVLAAARQEGKVMLYSQAAGTLRADMSKAFREKYGMDLEVTPGRGDELLAKVEAERRAGLYMVDAVFAGVGTAIQFKVAGLLDPIEPALILPEVVDPKAWMGNGIYYTDKEHTTISFFSHAGSTMIINTNLVKPEEIKSYNDLLSPKWKGKIVLDNPTVSGAGSSFYAFNMKEIMGPQFASELIKNDLKIVSDVRQLVEWVARGTYPIGLAPRPEIYQDFLAAGAPLKFIIPQEGTFATGGNGTVSLVSRPPHPNAAVVFVNWLLSKDGQTVMVKGAGDQSRRVDVTAEYIDEDRRVKPGVKYLDTENEEMTLKRLERMKEAKELFAPLLK